MTPELVALITQILPYVAALVGGYLLRHWGVNLPLLPSAPASPPAAPTVAPVPSSGSHPILSGLEGLGGQLAPLAEQLLASALQQAASSLHAKVNPPAPASPAPAPAPAGK